MRLALTAFTKQGCALADRLAEELTKEGDLVVRAAPNRIAKILYKHWNGYESLAGWTGERFRDCDGLLFVGACGIAVRAIAPYVRDKFQDPAVVSVDEAGHWAVPLLSGHVGGANALAERVARHTGGIAAISTATDVEGRFAVDRWSSCKGLWLDGRTEAKLVSAALLSDARVGLTSICPIHGNLPDGVRYGPAEVGIAVTLDPETAPFPTTLRLIPPVLGVGIGCRRGTPAETIQRRVEQVLAEHHLSRHGIAQIGTIDLKKDEPGLLAFCRMWDLPLAVWSAEELAAVEGQFTPSAFVKGVTGVDNVCERAAVRMGGDLIVPKQAGEGVTVAVARRPCTISFEEETPWA